MKEIPLLTSEDIEVRVKQINKTGALLLLYKTARVDARILDQTFGILNWTNEYKTVKDNLYCRVGVRENENQEFVYKEDCGKESEQDDGNEKKAEASDAFKRCCSKLGIGRELYTAPVIWANVGTVETNGHWQLKNKYAKYIVTHIAYNKDTRVITELEISNAETGVVVYKWSMPTNEAMSKKMVNTLTNGNSTAEENKEKEIKQSSTEKIEENVDTQTRSETKMSLQALKVGIRNALLPLLQKDPKTDIAQIVGQLAGTPGFRCDSATEEQYDIVLKVYQGLTSGNYNG
jgi:hypothetical protein